MSEVGGTVGVIAAVAAAIVAVVKAIGSWQTDAGVVSGLKSDVAQLREDLKTEKEARVREGREHRAEVAELRRDYEARIEELMDRLLREHP